MTTTVPALPAADPAPPPLPRTPRRGDRVALALLLAGTAALYLWDLGASGWPTPSTPLPRRPGP
ncbi:hypothetical protein [Pseudonocardia sp. SCN 73-27]|uniref:hypothetical protein n=1 Tax=Pseudonocardia sp. SCN 73-27 TaxID=1660132 RepID=UPI000AE9E807